MAKITIDEARHIIYTLSFKDFDEERDIRPWEIDIFYLGAFGEGFSRVTFISQNELEKECAKSPAGNPKIPLQVVGLHYISITESSETHFMLVTSIGQRIYISLDVKEYDTEKLKERVGFTSYTQYFHEIPNGKWKIAGVTNPPVSKDITGISSFGISCWADIDFDHTELCVTKTSYDKGWIFMNGLNRTTNKKVLLYINDSETFIKSKHELNSRNGATEKFWTILVGQNKHILDIQRKPSELYVDSDVLNVIGYLKKKPSFDNLTSKAEKTKHNEYICSRKNIYSEQVFLPGEEYLIMQNTEVYTMVKVS